MLDLRTAFVIDQWSRHDQRPGQISDRENLLWQHLGHCPPTGDEIREAQRIIAERRAQVARHRAGGGSIT